MTLNKSELITAIAKETTYPKTTVTDILNSVMSVIETELVDGGEVMLPGFIKFGVRKKEASTGRNPSTGKAMEIPAKRVVTLKAGASLKRAVAECKC